jgi:hypothetical protein
VSESRLCFDVVSGDAVYSGSVVSRIDQPNWEECDEVVCRRRNGFLRDTFNVRLVLQPNGSFAASGSFSHKLFDESFTVFDTGEECHSTRHEVGSGAVISYGGTITNPAGFLTARYTVTETLAISPCRGQPGSTSTDTDVTTTTLGTNGVTPVYDNGFLTAIVWNFSAFDQPTNTSYSTTGQVSLQ